MSLPLMIHSALVLFAQRTRIPTSARSIGFFVILVCISSSSSSSSSMSRRWAVPISMNFRLIGVDHSPKADVPVGCEILC